LNDGTNTYLYGAGRIAQVNTTTEYFLGDALGSVRQMTDATGEITLAKSYQPYGEMLASVGNGTSPFAFTGEQQDVSGLTYLRARYYSSGDGRFTSKDTWMGDYNSPLSLNRWNYVEGNPINLTDPSGHDPWWCKDTTDPVKCRENWTRDHTNVESSYGISFSGNWSWSAKNAVYDAVIAVGNRLSTLPVLLGMPPYTAFRRVYKYGVNFSWDTSCSNCRPTWCQDNNKWENPVFGLDNNGNRVLIDSKGNAIGLNGEPFYCKPVGGVTINKSKIEFASLFSDSMKARNNVVHELGHVFNNLAGVLPAQSIQAAYVKTPGLFDCYRENWPKRTNPDYGPNYGFASPKNQRIWQMHYSVDSDIYTEEFADMFLGWTFNTWEVNQKTQAGTTRSDWMNTHMPGWVGIIVNGQ
jgi:RHS repeat-associated protein